ncbi:MAG: LysR family transcriptional regulator [Rudaea sp.]|uniref:LysR family transcriptional regulator n=1 Tax=unclassified Rudaea TaxID=2627037 RepID=UPI0010F785C5|nr:MULTISPECIES: LysR family transcriptional regulator [unclassified Rudaea]MBN8885421.1 LysR family transcriptional regulator [Rudaea sp.]MBR0346350.1 LysR family transcriptional regulator [Rudaea sp.]
MNVDWSDLRIFLAVARSGSLGAAARLLGLSHPTVGRRLRALEKDAGYALVQRHSDGVVLTDAGEAALRWAEQMEANALAMQRQLAGDHAKPEGALRISAPDWFAAYVLPCVLEELILRHPGITAEVLADTRLFDLSRREADIAFRVVPFTEPNIVQRHLMRVDYAAYVARDAPDPNIDGGAATNLLLMTQTERHRYPEVDWLQRMLPRARSVFSGNHRHLQARLCERGLGVAVLPCPLGDRTEGLRCVDLGDAPPARDVWMGYHEDVRGMDRLRAMAEIAVRLLGAPVGS